MKADGIGTYHYWDRLKELNILSVGRRNERYKLNYLYKVINRYVDNCGFNTRYTDTAGRKVEVVNINNYSTSHRENSFHFVAPRLFNILPRYLRDDNYSSVES